MRSVSELSSPNIPSLSLIMFNHFLWYLFSNLSITSVANSMALFSFSSINGSKHSANLVIFHFVIFGWFEKEYLPNWSIELKTVLELYVSIKAQGPKSILSPDTDILSVFITPWINPTLIQLTTKLICFSINTFKSSNALFFSFLIFG